MTDVLEPVDVEGFAAGDPAPGAGCPLVGGWRIVVEAYYNPIVGTRVYGNGTYGAAVYGDLAAGILGMQYGANSYGYGVYGDLPATGSMLWNDVTEPGVSSTIDRGSRYGDQVVDVDQLRLEVDDETAKFLDPAVPQHSHQIRVGSPVRVGVLSPAAVYYPLATGIVDRFVDEHDDAPRVLDLEAFGTLSDTMTAVIGWNPPAQTAKVRADNLLSAVAWRWNPAIYPAAVPNLTARAADADTPPIPGRDALDETARSAGWTLDTDRRGSPRFRIWPIVPDVAVAAVVVDCAPGLVAPRITFAADTAALLNYVSISNTDTPPVAVTATDPATGSYGKRSELFGYPATELSIAAADLQAIADRIRDRYGRIVNRVAALEADTLTDPAWLPVLADLDTGRRLTVTRKNLEPVTSSVIVVGYQHRLERGRWRATIYTIPA